MRNLKVGKIKNFIKESKSELKKVDWPSKDEVINSTVVVLVSIAFISIGLGILDVSLSAVLDLLMGA